MEKGVGIWGVRGIRMAERGEFRGAKRNPRELIGDWGLKSKEMKLQISYAGEL